MKHERSMQHPIFGALGLLSPWLALGGILSAGIYGISIGGTPGSLKLKKSAADQPPTMAAAPAATPAAPGFQARPNPMSFAGPNPPPHVIPTPRPVTRP